jgi:hypothetical protein
MNLELPLGTLDRGKKIPKQMRGNVVLCPNPNDDKEESICDAKMSARNADTYSLVAAGVGFGTLCDRHIPIPDDAKPEIPTPVPSVSSLPGPPSAPGLLRREPDSLPGDVIIIDMVPEPDECKTGHQKRADGQYCRERICLSVVGEIMDKNWKCKKCPTGVPAIDGKTCQDDCPSGELLAFWACNREKLSLTTHRSGEDTRW